MFPTDLLSIIRSLNTVYTAIGICHTSSVDCQLARSGLLQEGQSILGFLLGTSFSVFQSRPLVIHILRLCCITLFCCWDSNVDVGHVESGTRL